MGEHKRLYNLLQLISLLSKPGGYSVKRLAGQFRVTTRTIYRYFDLLRECGFDLVKNDGRYRFHNPTDSVNLLPLFTAEEEAVIRKAVTSLHLSNPHKSGLLKKLRLMTDPWFITELIVDAKTSGNIQTLAEAIHDKRRVILHQYHSLNSEPVLSRMVDPLGFSVNMKYVYGFDLDHQKVVQFKPERIGSVEITDTKYIVDKRYHIEKPDLFGMNGSPQAKVTLTLNRRALHLLLEEFPESRNVEGLAVNDVWEKGPSEESNITISLPVKGFEGVGRFVLGLPGEAEPVGPPEFLKYLENRMKRGEREVRESRKKKSDSQRVYS